MTSQPTVLLPAPGAINRLIVAGDVNPVVDGGVPSHEELAAFLDFVEAQRTLNHPVAVHRLGVAYPVEARIEGTGTGAIRRCVFSTGSFVEPITRWEEPDLLAFDVSSSRSPLEEWSPYGHIKAPHLHGHLVSRRGQFRLVERDGRVVLKGTT